MPKFNTIVYRIPGSAISFFIFVFAQDPGRTETKPHNNLFQERIFGKPNCNLNC